MKFFLIVTPIVFFALFVLWRALSNRPLSRFVLNVAVALFLLVYVLVTAALGIFWVARMDLPAFDLHYFFGYCVVLLLVVHLSFQLRILATFARRISPKAWLVPDGTALRRRVRWTGIVFCIAVVVAPIAWLALSKANQKSPLRVVSKSPHPGVSADTPSELRAPEVFVERRRGRVSALDYMHEESSYSRAGILRSVWMAPSRPLEIKSYPDANRLALPAPRPRAGAPFGPPAPTRLLPGDRIVTLESQPPSLSDVAEMAHYAAGVTSRGAESAGLLLRAAASSGALYPVDLYVVATKVRGLEPAAYYYEPHRHELVRVAGPHETLADALAEASAAREAPLVFVAAVTFDRTVVKYNVRSYRYVALDAGHVVANLALVAAALGIHCRLETLFDDERVGRALALDLDNEAALLVALCDRSSPPAGERTLIRPAVEPVTLPARADDVELTRLSQKLTSLRLKSGPAERVAVGPAPSSSVTGVALPPPESTSRDVFETIAARRSFREFRDAPLALSSLAAVARDATLSLPPLRGSRLVELHLLVRRVDGLEPGVYRYDAARGVLEPRARGDRSAEVQSAGLSQEVLGRAAVVFAWTLGDEAGRIDGPRDYRTANIEAGLGGEVAYLSATARGLGLCGVGAFYDAELEALLAHERSRPRTLYLQALGAR
jgi:SagB-type dehydrogenase family enzyme